VSAAESLIFGRHSGVNRRCGSRARNQWGGAADLFEHRACARDFGTTQIGEDLGGFLFDLPVDAGPNNRIRRHGASPSTFEDCDVATHLGCVQGDDH
jgi:hypothetical protein